MKFLIPIFSLMMFSSHLSAMENINKPEQKPSEQTKQSPYHNLQPIPFKYEEDKKDNPNRIPFGIITDEDLEIERLGLNRAKLEENRRKSEEYFKRRAVLLKRLAPCVEALESYYKTQVIYKDRPALTEFMAHITAQEVCLLNHENELQLKEQNK